jgi:CRP-like cAMP-binding protein
VAQPVLDAWSADAAELPSYPAGSWGPRAAFDLLARDGRRWVEVVNRDVLARVPLFRGADPVLLHKLALALRPAVAGAGEAIVRQGEPGGDLYFIGRGRAEAVDGSGQVLGGLAEGDYFGELALLTERPRNATVRAVEPCDLFALGKADFTRVLQDPPSLVGALRENARERYHLSEVGW